MSRPDCSKTSYRIAKQEIYNCACPQCNARFEDKALGYKWIEIKACPGCNSKRQSLKDKILQKERLLTRKEKAIVYML